MNQLYILTLLNIKGINRKTVSKLLVIKHDVSLDIEDIIELFEIAKKNNIKVKIPEELDVKLAHQRAKLILDKSNKQDIGCITFLDEDFPKRLKMIEDPPVILFYKGDKNCLYEKMNIALIGTRKPNEYSKKIAQRLGVIFGENNFIITSGLAKGCDEFGHIGSLSVGGKNIAVLPGGLDKIYPASNQILADKILENGGCLLSEYSIGTRPFKNNFIERDRLQSALSRGVVVVETGLKGGTMHTVNFTLQQNRILACYIHNDDIEEKQVYDGNEMLIRDGT